MTFIELKDLREGTVYKLRARNLDFGVYDGKGNFIGIRTKFTSRFLDMECERTTSKHFGTASAMEDVGVIIGLPFKTTLGVVCEKCQQSCNYDENRPETQRWQHDDGTPQCANAWAQSVSNRDLFKALETWEGK